MDVAVGVPEDPDEIGRDVPAAARALGHGSVGPDDDAVAGLEIPAAVGAARRLVRDETLPPALPAGRLDGGVSVRHESGCTS